VALADDGWSITTHARFEQRKGERGQSGGEHGYDPRNRSMHAVFVAAGPGLREGVTVAGFENIHVYEFMCRVLGLTPAKNTAMQRQLGILALGVWLVNLRRVADD
jgi:predicted AlkP superfamily pyrophosphatase or phosphodiesterase